MKSDYYRSIKFEILTKINEFNSCSNYKISVKFVDKLREARFTLTKIKLEKSVVYCSYETIEGCHYNIFREIFDTLEGNK